MSLISGERERERERERENQNEKTSFNPADILHGHNFV
jgi:hypothetical protein